MFAGIAQLVERLLAKEKVASSSLVSRSTRARHRRASLILILHLSNHTVSSRQTTFRRARGRLRLRRELGIRSYPSLFESHCQ